MATLVFLPLSKDGVSLSVEVHDSVTAKRVGRDVDLRTTPPDGRALVLAVEADELLRATWAELALKDSPTSHTEVPPVVRRAVETSMATTPVALASPPRGAVGARGAVERFTGSATRGGGITLLGGDLRGELWAAPRWGAALAVGYRFAPTLQSELGETATDVLHVGFCSLFAITRRDRPWGINAAIALDAFGMFFKPAAHSDAMATAKTDVTWTAAVALAGWLALASRLRLGWEVGAAYPIRPVVAASDAETLESTEGVALRGALDVVVDF
jgi:hypothetical protein